MLDKSTSRCLVDFEIKQAVEEEIISTSNEDLENRIQPSSFEPRIGDEVYVIDTESGGLFRPSNYEPVYRSLLQLPNKRRQKHTIDKEFEIKKGYSYLLPLEEKLMLPGNFRVKSSPKSSRGRVFILNRLLTDYHDCFDEVTVSNKKLELWLLLQPLAFNLIIQPGMTFNQLRFLIGNENKLTDKELEKEYQKEPILYSIEEDSLKEIKNPQIHDGLRLTLDISGKQTSGIVGFKARNNPIPIDIKEKEGYNVEEYFEPIIMKNNTVEIKPGKCYLLSSKEYIKIPSNLSAELKDHSHVGIHGPLHFAGFFDNGFNGCAVFEVRSEEISPMILRDGMAISELQIFRGLTPKKCYGKDKGSSYNGQIGPRLSNNFKKVDFPKLGKDYKKLNRKVLALPKRELLEFRDSKEGFEIITPTKAKNLEKLVQAAPMFSLRYDCEEDQEILQIVPYVLIFRKDNNKDEVFYYVRTKDIKAYGDSRLFGKYSIGVGGHINESDRPDYLLNCVKREVHEEEVKFEKQSSEPVLVGTLMASEKPVDRVHFGFIYAIQTDGNVRPKESSIVKSDFIPIDILKEISYEYNYETWSKILIPHLPEIKDFLTKTI
ncbi:MAG: 2'-deoxycytidine 5'-triphosphate deaminase [Candidatus Pacearchaeota archaeon]|nr:MAG: 2'-deoxycytidine 5'-triphosphate deaminase [Candidatus Pacearchaeota archaeon]